MNTADASAPIKHRVWFQFAVVAVIVACVWMALAFFDGDDKAWSITMPDGAELKLKISSGTNHVYFTRTWHRLIRSMPSLSPKFASAMEPLRWDSGSPSLIFWCSLKSRRPGTVAPEFVLLSESGVEIPYKRTDFFEDPPLTGVGERHGCGLILNSPVNEKHLKLQVYHTGPEHGRVLVGERRFRNPLYR